MDTIHYCDWYQKKGYCTDDRFADYMTRNCPKTCKFCKPGSNFLVYFFKLHTEEHGTSFICVVAVDSSLQMQGRCKDTCYGLQVVPISNLCDVNFSRN